MPATLATASFFGSGGNVIIAATLASASRHMCHGDNSMHAMTEHPCSLSSSRPAAELVTYPHTPPPPYTPDNMPCKQRAPAPAARQLPPRSKAHMRSTPDTTCPLHHPPLLAKQQTPTRWCRCPPPLRAHSPAAHQDGLAGPSYQLASIAARTKKAFCEYQDLTRTGWRLPGNSRACRPS